MPSLSYGMWDLLPWPGVEPGPLALRVQRRGPASTWESQNYSLCLSSFTLLVLSYTLNLSIRGKLGFIFKLFVLVLWKMCLVFLGIFALFLVMKAAKTNGQTNQPEPHPHQWEANTVNILAFFLIVIFLFSCRQVRLCYMHSFGSCSLNFFSMLYYKPSPFYHSKCFLSIYFKQLLEWL